MNWEQRWHPLREEWVIIAAHRNNRPWSGSTAENKEKPIPEYLPDCYLCPGNKRASGHVNPNYTGVFVFDNDFPCVDFKAPGLDALPKPPGIYQNRPAQGIARVVNYSPKHNLTLAELTTEQIVELLACWQEQYKDLGSHKDINHVLFFENKGEVVGVSNPHPHCQIYATNFVFKYIETEDKASRKHKIETGRVLFQDILAAEKIDGRRILAENNEAISFVPYFARYAYEVYVAPKETHSSMAGMNKTELTGFADVLRRTLVKFDNMWSMPFPYVMALHQAPTDQQDHSGFHFHIEFHPPLRKPNLLKFLAGPEIGGGSFLSDTSPEEKAAELRAQNEVHYKAKS